MVHESNLKKKGHWKIKCLKLKAYQEKKEKSDKKEAHVSVAQVEVDPEEVEIDYNRDLVLVLN